MTTCPCPTCRNIGPEHEEAQAARMGPPPRPSPGPLITLAGWQRLIDATNINRPDDPAAYEWHTRKDRKDATQ